MMTLNSSGLVAELYPDSLGDYHLLPDISYNHHPVFQHSDDNGLHIINNGIYILYFIFKPLNSYRKYLVPYK